MKTTYMLTSAMLLALAAPAYAQQVPPTTITQTTTGNTYLGDSGLIGPGPFFPGAGNTADVTGNGPVVTSVVGQTNNNVLNAIGQQAYVGVGNPFAITQGAGTYVIGNNEPNIGGVYMGASNEISATSNSALASTVTAGGFQSASNVLNVANIAPVNGATGSIGQVAGDANLYASNSMSATAYNGQATVTGLGVGTNGQSGYQSAYGSLNTAGVLLGGQAATTGNNPTPAVVGNASVDLNQQLKDTNSITSTNIAIANTTNASSSTIDPTVSNLAQSSTVAVNQMGFATATGTTSTAMLTGSQDGTYHNVANDPTGVALDMTVGNGAIAYTGTGGLNNSPFANGVGATTISGVTQNTTVAVNGVNAGAGVSLTLGASPTADPSAGFTQTVDGSQQSISSNNPYLYGIPSNGMLSSTGSGAATINGVARTASTDPFTQTFTNQQNTIAAGGTLSGAVTQSASNFGFESDTGYALNVAASITGAGAASVNNVSQNMQQSLNVVQSGGASNLQLAQNASNVGLGGLNAQYASGSTGSTISGAGQLASANVNVASLGAATGTITQNSNNVSLSNVNLLATGGGYNASVSGSQSASTSLNVIK